jgi:hypothetical protein
MPSLPENKVTTVVIELEPGSVYVKIIEPKPGMLQSWPCPTRAFIPISLRRFPPLQRGDQRFPPLAKGGSGGVVLAGSVTRSSHYLFRIRGKELVHGLSP